jgi:tRNA threonylcarbamoyladenosine biosynthesis protein TsaE
MFKKSIFFTFSPSQTRKTGQILAKELLKTRPGKNATLIGLLGDLGGGKTTFLQGFARGLGIKQKILSPTFVIIKKLQIPKTIAPSSKLKIKRQRLYHLDCYRIKKSKEILDLGFKEIISDPENIVAVEWVDKIMDILSKDAIILKFDYIDANKRRIGCTLKK